MPVQSAATHPMSDTVDESVRKRGQQNWEQLHFDRRTTYLDLPISRLPIFWCGSSGVGMVPRRPWGLGLKYIPLFPLLYLDLGEYWVRKSNLLYVYHVSLEKYFGLYFQKSWHEIGYSCLIWSQWSQLTAATERKKSHPEPGPVPDQITQTNKTKKWKYKWLSRFVENMMMVLCF